MLPTSLRPVALTSLTLGSVLAACAAQAPPAQAPAAPDETMRGLPSFLLLVPGGTVEIGLPSEALVSSACEVASPTKPELAPRYPEKVGTAMKRSASLLGRKKVEVEPFLLGKWPVKCSEYEVYVAHMAALKKPVRPPFDWWRFGREDDYNARLEDINRQFPKDKFGPLNFWDRMGVELPYKVADSRGRSIADQPVTYVNYRDAVTFAGWLGMRLPTEAEWTRAARGDGSHTWPWGLSPLGDRFSEQALQQLRILKSSDQVRKVVGTVAEAAGPFGHLDMFGQVWQLVSERGYRPINGSDAFADAWKRLQKDKVGALVQSPPAWKDDLVLAKGGSYLSFQEPIQLLLDARAPVQTIDVMESLGFRLAKSLKPGYDMLYSLLRGIYNRGPFGNDQDIDLAGQIGAERYELAANGFPTAYHAVSFAPVNWLTADKGLDLGKLLDKTHASPLLLGTFASTDNLLDPAVPAGHYSVLFRKEGMPRELLDAIKVGYKEVQAALKGKQKGDAEKPAEEPKEEKEQKEKEGKEKKATWREVLQKHGLTEKDLESKEAANGLKFVRIDGVEVTTERDVFLLHGNEGKIVAAIPASNHKIAAAGPFAPKLLLEGNPKGKIVAKFQVGMPLHTQNPKKLADVHFHVTLDRAMPTAETPWRVPLVTK